MCEFLPLQIRIFDIWGSSRALSVIVLQGPFMKLPPISLTPTLVSLTSDLKGRGHIHRCATEAPLSFPRCAVKTQLIMDKWWLQSIWFQQSLYYLQASIHNGSFLNCGGIWVLHLCNHEKYFKITNSIHYTQFILICLSMINHNKNTLYCKTLCLYIV